MCKSTWASQFHAYLVLLSSCGLAGHASDQKQMWWDAEVDLWQLQLGGMKFEALLSDLDVAVALRFSRAQLRPAASARQCCQSSCASEVDPRPCVLFFLLHCCFLVCLWLHLRSALGLAFFALRHNFVRDSQVAQDGTIVYVFPELQEPTASNA